MATKAINKMDSVTTTCALTANSPSSSPPMMLKAPLSVLGVLSEAMSNPSIATSKMSSCTITGRSMGSLMVIKLSQEGKAASFCSKSSQMGVSIIVRSVVIFRMRRK